MLRSWGPATIVLVLGAGSNIWGITSPIPWPSLVLLVAFIVMASLISPLPFPRAVSAERARLQALADGRPIVYWRPGCQYCLLLRARLGRLAGRAHWVNIWADPDGAAAVRAIAEGNETVPTVVVAGQGHVNPDATWVRDRLLSS